ncbi:MAG: hypothetical protein J6M60_00830 [Clostridia bacterium]|nr:hypothetical protein [Clostridia bacterium]
MNQREFKNFLMKDFKNLSIEKIEDTLDKIELKWLPEITDDLYNKFTKEHFRCDFCCRWPKIKECEEIHQTIGGKDVPVLNEEGKSEIDLVADVTFLIKYRICPFCKRPHYMSQETTSIKNRHYKKEKA